MYIWFISFLLLWFIFNERLSLELLVIGLFVSSLMCLFCRFIIGKADKNSFSAKVKKFKGGFRYFFHLLKQIFISSINVLRLVISPITEPEPELHYFNTHLKTDAARVILANSITITPGTITCKLEDDVLCVHVLDREMAGGLVNSDFEKELSCLEGIGNDSE